MRIYVCGNLFLQLGLVLVNISVGKERVLSLYLDLQKAWLTSLALKVLKDFVVSRAALLVLCEDAIDAVYCSISYELLEIR